MRNLFARVARRHAIFLAATILLLAGFHFLICAAVSTIDVTGVLSRVLASLPPPLRAVANERLFAGFTPRGIIAFGWNHPVAQALGCALAILLAARNVAGEIGAGTMELMLSVPLSRRRYLATQAGYALAALALAAAGGVLGTAIGARTFSLPPLGLVACARLAAAWFLLQAAWYGVALLVSAWSREGGRAVNVVLLAAVASYFVEVIGRLWAPASVLLPLSLYQYYAPQDVLVDGVLRAGPALVLALVAAGGLLAGAWRFERRDIP